MVEHTAKLLSLPVTSSSRQEDNTGLNQPQEISKPSVVFGRDLNSSDLLLLGSNKTLKRIFAEEYGINDDFSWTFPVAFSTTSKKVIIDDGKSKYFIKEKPKYCCDPYHLSLAAQFQGFLSDRVDFVPRIIDSKSGSSYLQIGETHFFTTEFREGRMFNGSLQDVENAGISLGIIHLQSQEFDYANPRKISGSEDVLQFIDLADQLEGSEKDQWKPQTILALRGTVNKYSNEIDRDLPYIANHGDYAPFNLVYEEKGVVAVNDFDNVNYRPRIRDLAGAIISFCDGLSYAGATSTLRSPISTSLSLEKVRAFMKGYLTNSPALSAEEKAQLVGEVCMRWTKIMALGIVRGDFNYQDVLQALPFYAFAEKKLPRLMNEFK